MFNRKTPISMMLNTVGTITLIGCLIIGFLYGAAYGMEASQNVKAIGVIAVFFGLLIRMAIGFLVGLASASVLWGFAKIVAWYEAVPPGYAYGMQPADDGSAPAAQPLVCAPVPVRTTPAARTNEGDKAPANNGVDKRHWKCPTCGEIRPNYSVRCSACGEYRPDSTPAPKPALKKPDDSVATWLCTCGAENPVSRGMCDSCGSAKPFPQTRR